MGFIIRPTYNDQALGICSKLCPYAITDWKVHPATAAQDTAGDVRTILLPLCSPLVRGMVNFSLLFMSFRFCLLEDGIFFILLLCRKCCTEMLTKCSVPRGSMALHWHNQTTKPLKYSIKSLSCLGTNVCFWDSDVVKRWSWTGCGPNHCLVRTSIHFLCQYVSLLCMFFCKKTVGEDHSRIREVLTLSYNVTVFY